MRKIAKMMGFILVSLSPHSLTSLEDVIKTLFLVDDIRLLLNERGPASQNVEYKIDMGRVEESMPLSLAVGIPLLTVGAYSAYKEKDIPVFVLQLIQFAQAYVWGVVKAPSKNAVLIDDYDDVVYYIVGQPLVPFVWRVALATYRKLFGKKSFKRGLNLNLGDVAVMLWIGFILAYRKLGYKKFSS